MLLSGIYAPSYFSQNIDNYYEHGAESNSSTNMQAMLRINEHMHKIWKSQIDEKPLQSTVAGWIMSLPFDMKAKEWLAAEERYKHEIQLNNILLAVADKFFLDGEENEKGASILCFDEIQVKENSYILL